MSLSPRPDRFSTTQAVRPKLARQVSQVGDGVGRLQRRDDPFQAAELAEALEGALVVDRDVLGPAGRLEEAVLGADARVVQAGRDAVRPEDLAVAVLEHHRARAVQHADAAR